MAFQYPNYEGLKLDRPADRVLRITISRGKINAMDFQLHCDLTGIWPLIDKDPSVNAVILTGAGKAFSAGGDFEMEKQTVADYQFRLQVWRDARDLVRNLLAFSKPIVSAINGAAVGAGLTAALLSDVSIAGRGAKIVDGHTRLGVAAGDHAAMLWPLLCGLAKAKQILLLCDALTGEEAERIGLVSMCVDDDKLQDKAVETASRLANGAPAAIRWTKNILNHWLHQAWPTFEAGLALEFLGFGGPEGREGVDAWLEKREPKFNPDSPV
ncbi:MAG: enoyl-CoA hydratase/isomerase family protein [Gammaproteobacteria bacterium]